MSATTHGTKLATQHGINEITNTTTTAAGNTNNTRGDNKNTAIKAITKMNNAPIRTMTSNNTHMRMPINMT